MNDNRTIISEGKKFTLYCETQYQDGLPQQLIDKTKAEIETIAKELVQFGDCRFYRIKTERRNTDWNYICLYTIWPRKSDTTISHSEPPAGYHACPVTEPDVMTQPSHQSAKPVTVMAPYPTQNTTMTQPEPTDLEILSKIEADIVEEIANYNAAVKAKNNELAQMIHLSIQSLKLKRKTCLKSK